MKVDNNTLKGLIAEGNIRHVMAAFHSQRRALAATENLLRARADQLAYVRRAYAELQDERDRLARGIDFIGKWFDEQGLGEKWTRLKKRYRLEEDR